jgi:O-antigen/teichoic acid export membrane protein
MSLRRSVFASVLGTYGVFAIAMAASMVLARLLTPAEMGVWSIAQAAMFLSATLRDVGAGDYLVRSGDLSRRAIGRVFALMLSISLVCALFLWFGRAAIAAFFHEPRLTGLIGITTLTYLLMPFGLGALVTMERELAFVRLQLIQLAAVATGSLTSIALALAGFSFYSLAWGQLVQMVLVVVLRAWARPQAAFCPPVFSGWGGIFHFGIFSTLNAVVSQVSTQSITAIIGRLLGFAPLGLYDRAQGLNTYVNNGVVFSVMQVVYVGLAKVKDDAAQMGRLFLVTLENFTGLLWPVYGLLALAAGPLLLVLFGPRWLAAAPLFQLICLGGMILACTSVNMRVLTAHARVHTIFLIEGAVMLLRAAGALALAPMGIVWLTFGAVAPGLVAVPLYWYASHRYLLMPRRELVGVVARSLAVLFATMVPPAALLASGLVQDRPALVQLPALLLAGGAGWLGGVRLTHHRLEGEVTGALRHGMGLVGGWWRPQAPPPTQDLLS